MSIHDPIKFRIMSDAVARAVPLQVKGWDDIKAWDRLKEWKHANSSRSVEISRSNDGDFALRAKINDHTAPMVIDTGATSVVLTYETAKAAGLPLELLDYNVDVETAGGHVRAARLTLDRLAVGKLVERSIPALVVPRGQMETNLLGMSFLNRLESWEVRADRLMLRGYP
ncbi:MAG: TIGR02281 family clan AA aspartic protease [Rhizobiales bacterium]|nr:TIGR02281 family clan AA aspartic protease [Hyphomicrobiales bacterium]